MRSPIANRSQKTLETPSSLGYSPSPTLKHTGHINDVSPENSQSEDDLDQNERPPPPPPFPDTFTVDVALEESRVPGHNVGTNAANVGKYMMQLERYLRVCRLGGLEHHAMQLA